MKIKEIRTLNAAVLHVSDCARNRVLTEESAYKKGNLTIKMKDLRLHYLRNMDMNTMLFSKVNLELTIKFIWINN